MRLSNSLALIRFTAILLSFLQLISSLPHNSSLELREDGHLLDSRTITTTNCAPQDAATLTIALAESILILQAAISALTQLTLILGLNPVPNIQAVLPSQRTIWQTFEAYFGRVYWPGGANNPDNAIGISYVTAVSATLSKVLNALNTPTSVNWYTYCGDTTLLSNRDPRGKLPPAGGYLFDNRYYSPTNPEEGMWIQTPSCAFDANMNAYTYSCPQSKYPWTSNEDVSVFCHMNLWTGLRLGGQSLTTNRANVYAPGSITTDLFSFFMPRCIIHEMTHSPSIMKGTQFMLIDQCQNGVKAYQYACVVSLAAQGSALALTNSDSVAMFAIAMYMNSNDWSTGSSQPVGYTPPPPP